MSAKWSRGSTADWRRQRQVAIDRNTGGRCQLAIPGVCTGKATEVHHTRDRRIVGDDPRYLMHVCGMCNKHVGDPSAGDPEPSPNTKW